MRGILPDNFFNPPIPSPSTSRHHVDTNQEEMYEWRRPDYRPGLGGLVLTWAPVAIWLVAALCVALLLWRQPNCSFNTAQLSKRNAILSAPFIGLGLVCSVVSSTLWFRARLVGRSVRLSVQILAIALVPFGLIFAVSLLPEALAHLSHPASGCYTLF